MMQQFEDYKINAIRFNQDSSYFICSLESGFMIFCSDPLRLEYAVSGETVGSIQFAELFGVTDLVALRPGPPKQLYQENNMFFWADTKKRNIGNIELGCPIKNFKYMDNKFIAMTEHVLHVFDADLSPQKFLCHLDMPPNPLCLIDTTRMGSAEKQICVIPGAKKGSIQIIDMNKISEASSTPPVTIAAHNHDIQCIAVNQDGTRVATASAHGTLIRIFDTTTLKMVLELRRGSESAMIQCLNFSGDSEYLVSSSDKGTVHIHAIRKSHLNSRSQLNNMHVLPSYCDSQWAFAKFATTPGCTTLCTFGQDNASVVAICMDGYYYKYSFSAEAGTCKLEKFDSFVDIYSEDAFYRRVLNRANAMNSKNKK